MSAVEISYKGSQIASMDATGVKTLLTGDTFCEDDIIIQYTAPSAPTPTGTKQITISGAGTITEDVTNYANAEITTPAGIAKTPELSPELHPVITVSNTGLITATASWIRDVTPTVTPGYVSSGTSGRISASGSSTHQLIVYAGAHHSIVSAYTVVVSLTNPVNPGEFNQCAISEWLSSSQMDTGNTLDTIDSPTGSATISVDDSLYGVAISVDGSSVGVPASGISCTGDVQLIGQNQITMEYLFMVTGDGTITFDGVDYDD